jgi:hypothetical protein
VPQVGEPALNSLAYLGPNTAQSNFAAFTSSSKMMMGQLIISSTNNVMLTSFGLEESYSPKSRNRECHFTKYDNESKGLIE